MFTHRLKVARKNKNLTQEQLANIIKTSKSTISNYENGYSTPSNNILVLLAQTLETTTDYLLGNDATNTGKIDEQTFQVWMNNPNLKVFYNELPLSDEDKIQQLRDFWEFLKLKK